MEDLKKRILLDALITPTTVIPFLLGGTMMLMSEMLGEFAAFIGFAACALSIGAAATNLIFNIDKIAKRAMQKWQDSQQKTRERELDALDRKLAQTPEDADEVALRNLRGLYRSFCQDFAQGKINRKVPPLLIAQIDDLFNACVIQLGKSYEMWEQARQVNGKLRRDLLVQRKQVITDVESSVEKLAQAISEIRVLKLKANRGQLAALQKRLETQLEVAKAVETRMMQIEQGEIPVEDRLREYQQ